MSVSAPANDPALSAEPRPPIDAATSANHSARATKLGIGVLGIYGSGALVENITTLILGQLLLFYLTIVSGMSGTEAGFILMVALVVDSTIDPVVGSISDNSRSRHGRRHPFMLASLIPIVIALAMLFSIPRGLREPALFLYALVTLLAVRIGISVFYVPYMALGAELSDDYAERSTIVAARVLFTVAGGVLFPILAFGVFLKGPHGRFDHDAYTPLALSCGAVVAFGALLSALGTLRARGRLHAAADSAQFGVARFLGEVDETFRNRSFVFLFLCCLILFAGLGAAGALTLHAYTFFWKLKSGQIEALGLVAPIGLLVGIFIAALMAKAMEKRNIARLGLALIGLAQLAPVALRLTHVTAPPAYVPSLITAVILGGFGAALATISFQSMMADAADEHEHLFGARREGLYFAGITLSAKAASGLGLQVGGFALDAIGFPHGLTAASAASAVSTETATRLGVLYGPGAALFTLVSVVLLFGFRLSRRDHERIILDLNQRRSEALARR